MTLIINQPMPIVRMSLNPSLKLGGTAGPGVGRV